MNDIITAVSIRLTHAEGAWQNKRMASLLTGVFLSALLCSGLAGCATPQQTSENTLSVAEQKEHTAVTGNSCPQAKQERSYVEHCTSSTSRDPNTPIHDIPGSVQIINRDLIDDQKALTIGDALRNVSGVQGGR